MNYTNNYSARASYDKAKQIYFDAWIKSFGNDAKAANAYVDGLKLSQGEIRCEVELNATNNIFTFGVTSIQTNTQNIIFPTENRLEQQNSLVVSEFGLFVCKPASRTVTTFPLRTYGNTQDFTAAAAAALNSTLYSNGSLQLKVNNDVIVPYRGILGSYYSPQTQETAPLGAGSPNDQFRGAEDGFVTAEPNIILIGSKAYIPQLVMNSNLAVVDEFTRAVLIFRGILAQNSTVIN